MRLETNLSGVLGRVSRLQTHDLPRALTAALAPNHWLERARAAAEKALLAVADPAQQTFVPGFVQTIMADGIPDALLLSMKTPAALRRRTFQPTIKDYQAARGAVSPALNAWIEKESQFRGPVADEDASLHLESVLEFQELMAEWVATEKEKGPQDIGRTDEQIGNFIAYSLLTEAGSQMVVKNGKNKGKLVRDVFLPHITAWLQKKQSQPLAPEVIEAWLRTVLAAWIQMFRVHFPAVARQELRASRAQLAL